MGISLHHGNRQTLQIRVVLYFCQRPGFPVYPYPWLHGNPCFPPTGSGTFPLRLRTTVPSTFLLSACWVCNPTVGIKSSSAWCKPFANSFHMKCEGEMKLLLLETGAGRNSLCSVLKHSSSKAATAGEFSSFSVWRLIPGGSQNHRGTRKESARNTSLPSLLLAGSRRLYLPPQCEHSPSSSPASTWSSAMTSGSVLTSLQMVGSLASGASFQLPQP